MPLDLATDYAAFRESAGAVELPRDFVRAAGPDVIPFLQGQLSQDVAGLSAGTSTWALLLQPQGKVVAFLRVLRVGEDDFVLETDAGFGQAVIERLNRFKRRVKADLYPLVWMCVAVSGPLSHELVEGGVVTDWTGLPGADLIGESVSLPQDVPWCSPEAYAAVRIEAGIPVM